MLKNLLESLDSKIFKPELVESVQAEFDKAVNEQVLVNTTEAKAELLESNEVVLTAEKERLVNESAEQFELLKEETAEKLNEYLGVVVAEIVESNEIALAATEDQVKSSALVEAITSTILTAGVEVAKIDEAKDATDAEIKLAEQVEINNNLVEENLSVKAQNSEFLQIGAINEMKEGLSLVESEKFVKLSELVEFSNDSEFVDKLETLKESVKGKSEVAPEKDAEEEKLDESVKEDKPAEKCAFSHLL